MCCCYRYEEDCDDTASHGRAWTTKCTWSPCHINICLCTKKPLQGLVATVQDEIKREICNYFPDCYTIGVGSKPCCTPLSDNQWAQLKPVRLYKCASEDYSYLHWKDPLVALATRRAQMGQFDETDLTPAVLGFHLEMDLGLMVYNSVFRMVTV